MKKILFILLPLLLCSCRKEAQETYSTSNNEIKVDFLFEVDGVRVYRFKDAGHFVYFTNRSGETESSYTTQVGNTCITHYVKCYNN